VTDEGTLCRTGGWKNKTEPPGEKHVSVPLCPSRTPRGLVRIEPRVPLEPEDEGNMPSETSGSVTATRRSIPEGFDLQTVLDVMECAYFEGATGLL